MTPYSSYKHDDDDAYDFNLLNVETFVELVEDDMYENANSRKEYLNMIQLKVQRMEEAIQDRKE